MKIVEQYSYAGKPAELVKITVGARVAIYLIRVSGQLVSTCFLDQRFNVFNKPVREVRA
jgi:hypothetical protein